MTSKKPSSSILGGSSLKEKLSLARQELDNLQEKNSEIHNKQCNAMVKQKITRDKNSLQEDVEFKFHLTGRCDRKKHKYITKAFYILENLELDIKLHCSGGDVAIFNYLMYLGLQEVKKRKNHSFDEVIKMESAYNPNNIT